MSASLNISNLSIKEKVDFTWDIERFTSKHTEICSQDFYENENNLFDLILNPKVENGFSFDEHASIHLRVRSALFGYYGELSVYYRLLFLNQRREKCDTKEGHAKFVNDKLESNWQYIVSRDYLAKSGFLVGDKLSIYCEVYVLNIPPPAGSPVIIENKPSTMCPDLQRMFESLFVSKKCADVILVVGEKQFPAHKLILCARSPVFAAMFEHDCEEKKTNRVQIEDIDGKILEELLRYIYTDKVSSLEKYSVELMVAADKYQIDSLKSICESYLSSNLTIEIALKLLLLSDMHNAANLKTNCLEYITNHSAELKLGQWKALAPELAFRLYECLATKYNAVLCDKGEE